MAVNAQFGPFRWVALDAAGNALENADIEVRKQGATADAVAFGSGTFNVSVADVGSLEIGHAVNKWSKADDVLDITKTWTVTDIIDENTIELTGASLIAVAVGDRFISQEDAVLFQDAQGATAESNPLSTDAVGVAFAWLEGGKYDVLMSGAGLSKTFVTADVEVIGDSHTVTTFSTGSSVARNNNTLRALATTDILERWQNNGATKVTFYQDGTVALAGDLTVNDITSATGITITAGGLTVTAGGITITAGDLVVNDDVTIEGALGFGASGGFARLVVNQGTTITSSEISLNGAWGSGATVTNVLGTDTRFSFTATAGTGSSAGQQITITFKDGAFAAAPFILGMITNTDDNVTIVRILKLVSLSTTQMVWEIDGAAGSSISDGNFADFTFIVIG